jgi:amidase
MPALAAIENDRLGAFVRGNPVAIAGAASGLLAMLEFGLKDAFDVRGYRNAAGNPDWLRTHPPTVRTATVVDQLLAAGANLVGKTLTDELTFSLNGENIHYGTPVNSKAPDRIPGGSSSGSAAAVAGELVDFAIGTDCGGSVRAPASFCGIYGMRPSHGRISVDGVFPLAPSFDTVGWFARDAKLLQRVGQVLLPVDASPKQFRRLLIASDAFAWSGGPTIDALQLAVDGVESHFNSIEKISVAPNGLTPWFEAFRILQGAEIWAEHGDWIRAVNPNLAPGIRERFEWTSTISAADVADAQPIRDKATNRMHELLGDDAVLCLPTTGVIAPLLNLPADDLAPFRSRAMSLLCIAGLARLPQINLPLATLNGCPLGLSIIGPHAADLELLELAARLPA